MSIEADLRTGVLAALAADPTIAGLANGVHDGRPTRATPPYVALGEMLAADWSVKGAAGRELRLTLVIADTDQTPARMFALADAALGALAAVPRTLGGWQLGAFVHLRSLTRSLAVNAWSTELDVRVRALQLL